MIINVTRKGGSVYPAARLKKVSFQVSGTEGLQRRGFKSVNMATGSLFVTRKYGAHYLNKLLNLIKR